MVVLVTGACGFIGSYLMEYFDSIGVEVWGTIYSPTINLAEIEKFKEKLLRCDVRYLEQVLSVLEQVRPDLIFHMAAQSYPALSWRVVGETFDTNINGTANVFIAIKKLQLSSSVLVACSSAEYGIVAEDDLPVKETHPLLPLHPYGVSKVAQDLLAYQYFVNDHIKTFRPRIFNTTGVRKKNDVCADFTSRAVAIEKGNAAPLMKVGNLEPWRAILDVRDAVKGLVSIATHGTPGEVYNICSKQLYQVKDILALVLKHSTAQITVEQDLALLRPTDEKIIYGDSTKLISETDWEQSVNLEETIVSMMEYWRRINPKS